MHVYDVFLYGSTYLGDGATDRRKILHDGRYGSRADLFPFGAPGQYPQGIPKIYNFGRLKTEYLRNGKWQRYMSIRA